MVPSQRHQRFRAGRSGLVGIQERLRHGGRRIFQADVQDADLILRIPDLFIKAAHLGALLVGVATLVKFAGITVRLSEVKPVAGVVRLGLQRFFEQSSIF